jgi:prolyl oligopeptidase
MTKYIIFLFIIIASLIACDTATTTKMKETTITDRTMVTLPPVTTEKKSTITYPITRRDETVSDNYHGTTIADPYRWLEDDHSAETADWVNRQNAVTFDYLSKIPYRDAIKKRLSAVYNYERFSAPFKKNNVYFFYKNDGLQNQSVLYRQNTLTDVPKLVIDPNNFSKDGTSSLSSISISNDGKYMAYQVSKGGSDWQTIYVQDLKTGAQLTDSVKWCKFSGISWQKDGFFYSRYAEPKAEDALKAKNEFHQVYYHKLGTPQSKDMLIFVDEKNAQRNAGLVTTDDERFAVLVTNESTSGNAMFFKDLSKNDKKFTAIRESFDSDMDVVDNIGANLYILTNYKAPNKRLVRINTANPAENTWVDILPETNMVLTGVAFAGGKIVATYLKDATSAVKIYAYDGKFLADLTLPELGTMGAFEGDKADKQAFFSFSSYIRPTTIYELDMNNLTYKIIRQPKVSFDSDAYETKQVFFTSYDGTKVPMFITHKKGLVMDGARPTLLYGYGGFDISLMPNFDPMRLPIIENGGIFAVANLRGGGEYGQKWHVAGTKAQKQNVFNDFQAAAEYLIQEKYTASAKLAIDGRSNGGLLVGACMLQRPDLYKVAFPGVGVLDMLRYHKFTIGWAWAIDYGRSDEANDFPYLIKYSPLHNVKKTAYPATLINTADHDDRVVPAHSFKFAAELQSKQQGDNPTLIRIDKSAGHGAGKPTTKRIEEVADMLAFMWYNMGEKY